MSQMIEIKVPDIGDFHDVPVIELLVQPGQAIEAEDALLTLESDKATIDVPSPVGGRLKEFKVKVGDKVSEGSLIALVEGGVAASAAAPAATTPAAEAAPARWLSTRTASRRSTMICAADAAAVPRNAAATRFLMWIARP